MQNRGRCKRSHCWLACGQLLLSSACLIDERDPDVVATSSLEAAAGAGALGGQQGAVVNPMGDVDGGSPTSTLPQSAGEPSPMQLPALVPGQVEVVVVGAGRVRSTPAGIDCPGTCRARFDGADSVTLTASGAPDSGNYFAGWSGDCAGFDECRLTLERGRNVSVGFGPANIAFITSETYIPGTLGGIEGADARCRARAQAGGLEGNYVAWISNASVDAIDRLRGARGWIRPDGLEVVDSAEDILTGRVFYPPRLNELGVDVLLGPAFTGTNATGRWSSNSCGNWDTLEANYTSGNASCVGECFSEVSLRPCDITPTALYCFGIDHAVRVEPVRAAGRLAFVSTIGFSSGGGIGSADQVCQTEAQRAGLAGSFLAELAQADSPPEARFNLDGPPWVRVDGVLLNVSAAKYFSDMFQGSAPNVTATGNYLTRTEAWTGQLGSMAPTIDGTCDDWRSTTGTEGVIASVQFTLNRGGAAGRNCSNFFSLSCLQQ
jgi:hypothetical protein